MHRTSLALVVTALLATVALPVAAQDVSSADEVDAARQLVREGALQIVREELALTDEQAEAFWPLYDRYRAEILEVEDTYVDLLREFLQKHYGYGVTDDDAKEYVDMYFDIQGDILKIRKKYRRRFRRILSDIEVMRLYQIENKIRAEIDAALAVTVPLADPN